MTEPRITSKHATLLNDLREAYLCGDQRRTRAGPGMNAPEKILDRSTFLGGSDAAAVVGLSPWKTPLEVFFQKRGEAEGTGRETDPEIQELLETGKEMEPVIVNRLIRRYGVKVTKRSTPEKPNRYVDQEYDFLAAEIDFEWEVTPTIAARFCLPADLVGTIQNGEAKKVHQFAGAQFGESETEDVPIQYAAQAAHGLGVTRRQLTLFAVQIGDTLLVYWIYRDEETITELRRKLVAFWDENVLPGVPPKPIVLKDIYQMFRRVPPIAVEASAEALQWCENLERARIAAQMADEQQLELKFRIGKFMLGQVLEMETTKDGRPRGIAPTADATPGAHVLTYRGEQLLEVALQNQTRIDGDRLKRERPEIAADYQKPISFFRFDRPRKKRA